MKNDFRFAGHETFSCRTFWPKKGYDFILSEEKFNESKAPSILGVGKNMVASIHFWMRAMKLLDDNNKVTGFASMIFGENGYDPFLEDVGTIWLLHSRLITEKHASIYSMFFNDFRIKKPSFSKQQFANHIKTVFKNEGGGNYNPNTIDKDISVFCKSYNQPDFKNVKKNFEDEVSNLLLELELMKSTKVRDTNNKYIEWYSVEASERHNLSSDIVFYYILEQYEKSTTIQFRNLLTDNDGPGKVFCLHRNGLYAKLKEQEIKRDGVFISETAGNVVLNIPEDLNPTDVLNEYYGN